MDNLSIRDENWKTLLTIILKADWANQWHPVVLGRSQWKHSEFLAPLGDMQFTERAHFSHGFMMPSHVKFVLYRTIMLVSIIPMSVKVHRFSSKNSNVFGWVYATIELKISSSHIKKSWDPRNFSMLRSRASFSLTVGSIQITDPNSSKIVYQEETKIPHVIYISYHWKIKIKELSNNLIFLKLVPGLWLADRPCLRKQPCVLGNGRRQTISLRSCNVSSSNC